MPSSALAHTDLHAFPTRRSSDLLDAQMVWDKMILGAWRTGEPGVFYVDEANRYNPVPHLGAYEATNPCGEQPLLPYDVCNLGSINRSEEHTSELQSRGHLVCRLLPSLTQTYTLSLHDALPICSTPRWCGTR